jgi:PilZ domain
MRDDFPTMTRREAVRVKLFARGRLAGIDRTIRCAVIDLSAGGALLTFSAPMPAPPLRLALELGGEQFDFAVLSSRPEGNGRLAVSFRRPYSERLYRLIAVEQRRALSHGRSNISDRRVNRVREAAAARRRRDPGGSGA